MNFPNTADIIEVGPRDGLQNEHINLPSKVKIDFINKFFRPWQHQVIYRQELILHQAKINLNILIF